MKNNSEILDKAKTTIYKHKDWFREGKSVYYAINYFVESGDFYLDIPKKYMSIHELNKIGYEGVHEQKAVEQWMINTRQYDKLIIRHRGREGGSDKGMLKVETFIILKNRK